MDNIKIEDIKRAIKETDCRTARARRSLRGREINIEPTGEEIALAATNRGNTYLQSAKILRESIRPFSAGITAKELECVEFVIEQLEEIAKIAFSQTIDNY